MVAFCIRQVSISPVKCFSARLRITVEVLPQTLNTFVFFFAQFIIEQKKVSECINIALKKVYGQSVTASQLRANLQRLVVNLICQDQAHLFQRQY